MEETATPHSRKLSHLTFNIHLQIVEHTRTCIKDICQYFSCLLSLPKLHKLEKLSDVLLFNFHYSFSINQLGSIGANVSHIACKLYRVNTPKCHWQRTNRHWCFTPHDLSTISHRVGTITELAKCRILARR